MNVILIGMPGAGKSTVGVLLAKALGKRFTDTDLVIQEQEGRRLCEIIAEDGAAAFGRIENDVLLSLHADDTVVATGGSAVFCPEGMDALRATGITVWLKAPVAEIKARLGNAKARGVIMREGETAEELERERAPLYEKYADVTVEETGDIEDTVRKTLAALRAFGSPH